MYLRSLLASVVLSIVAVTAHAKESPLERTGALVNAFKEVRSPAEGQTLSTADRDANKAAFKKLDNFFDYDTLTSEPLAPHKAKLTAEQRTKIPPLFGELIRLVAYPKSGNFLRDAKYQLKAGAKAGEVVMDASLPAEDFRTTVIFHWKEKGGVLRIVDVSFDGASLVKDYQNQFGRIIEKESGAGLLKKITTRLEKERQSQGV